MTPSVNLWSFISNASLVVQLVMLILLLASLTSWTIIFQRRSLLKNALDEVKAFEKHFWSGVDMDELYQQINRRIGDVEGLGKIFHAGLNEYQKASEHSHTDRNTIIEATQRAMRIAEANEMEMLEKNVSFLATVGSVSPYIGLFGTVWGIMTSFQALGTVTQATIAMVAPGISEALIATAIGLFAAIPAVIAYNRFSSTMEKIAGRYERFQEELINLLLRRTH